MTVKIVVLALLVGLIGVGCAPEAPKKTPTDQTIEKPTVSDANCRSDNLARMDPRVRQSFADDCARSGTFKPNSGRTW